MAQIYCGGVALGYEGQCVTENINFEVNKGDYLCIVGENGSGKSTLVKALIGIIKPLKGSIDTKNIKMGYLPQQTDIRDDFPASVKEVVLSGYVGRKSGFFYSKEQKKGAIENMKKLGIADLSKRSLRELSGGQRQRVMIARALCAADDILVLDEPVTGLDPAVTAELYEILKVLNKKEEMTVIMVSHDLNSALKYATKILHIGQTQLFFGSTAEYIKSGAYKLFSKSRGAAND